MGQGCGQEESKSGCFKSAKLIKVTVWLIVPQRKYIVRRFLEARSETFVVLGISFLLYASFVFSLLSLLVRNLTLLNPRNTKSKKSFFFLQKIADQPSSLD